MAATLSARVTKVWKRDGMAGVVRAVAQRLHERFRIRIDQHVIVQRHLRETACSTPLPQGLAIRQVTREDLALLKPFEERRSQETLSRWLNRGYILVLAKQSNGTVVAFHCISHEHPYPLLLSRAVPLHTADVWMAETYVLPEWRGNGLYDHLKWAADRLALARGFTRAVGTVAVQNLASRKANARVGSREVGRCWFFSTRRGRGCLVWRKAVDGSPGALGLVTTHRSWMLSTR